MYFENASSQVNANHGNNFNIRNASFASNAAVCNNYDFIFQDKIPGYYIASYVLLSGLILGLRLANERRRYFVTTSLIDWVQA